MKYLIVIISCFIGAGLFAQPANDLCTGATSTVADGTCYAGTTSAAADNITGEVGCATQGGANGHRDIWYSFTPTTNTVQFDITSPSGSTIELLLISGTCAALTLENSTCMTSPLNSTFSGLVAGQTYFYVVSFPTNTQSTITTCVTSIAAPPESGQNCTTASPICSNSSFGGNSDGYGTQELSSSNQGCLASGERQSSWYYFQIETSGTLDMTIDPTSNVDYDFALWGPMSAYSCPVSGSPVRCSYASGITTLVNTGSYNTGFGPLGTEASDGTSGTLNGWASSLTVTAGQFYILCIDNFSVDNTPFTLSWGGSSVLSCALLPIELTDFTGRRFDGHNLIQWTTKSEDDNDRFVLERSTDARRFVAIHEIDGAGNSNVDHHYIYRDYGFNPEMVNYYRLKQIDFNGTETVSSLIAVNNLSDKEVESIRYYDFTGREINPNQSFTGLVFIITEFADGTFSTEKKWYKN